MNIIVNIIFNVVIDVVFVDKVRRIGFVQVVNVARKTVKISIIFAFVTVVSYIGIIIIIIVIMVVVIIIIYIIVVLCVVYAVALVDTSTDTHVLMIIYSVICPINYIIIIIIGNIFHISAYTLVKRFERF